MRRVALALAVAGAAATQLVGPSGNVDAYVAVDADGNRDISVGDTIGWFIEGDQVVTLRCWTDETKTSLVQRYVSRAYSPKAVGEPTGKAVVLTSPGYCESTGSGGGIHWFLVTGRS